PPPPPHTEKTDKPLLTIMMALYNKENYLKDALDSILMQETTYKYQILISDNASTNNSLKIAKEYQAQASKSN
ncbi:glycosyltransferase, partial [Helicobacter sp.]|uniref:glycosyltransferase family 2 protein n=2 Tax=Helicobacter sp. TaxID=218 RepID=UPI002A74A5EB